MGHFTIDLPYNQKGDVRWGKVTKAYIPFFALFRRKSLTRDEKTGYIIQVISTEEEKMEYRLFMSKDGNWFQDADGTLPVENDHMAVTIKEAIIKFQSQIECW